VSRHFPCTERSSDLKWLRSGVPLVNPFHYAKNFFSDDFLPQQLTWAFGLLLLSLVAVIAGLVLLRRALGEPRRSSKGAQPPPGSVVFERYEIGARLWHVGLVGILLALWISGFAFYAPGSVPGPVPVIGMSWLWVHLAFALMFMLGIVVHMIKAPLAGGRTMLFDRHDWHQLVQSVRYYCGLPHELPKLGKYGVTSKLFHVALILLALIMIVSGISMTLDTLGWAEMDPSWQRRERLLHDFGSYGFLALVAGHVFWQLLKSRSQSKAMITGTISAETFSANHDWAQWKPDADGR
jgi:cytochrome b subunit of formate dehydrogenase